MPAMKPPADYEAIACDAARSAGRVLRSLFRSAPLNVESKGPCDYVTDADRQAEEAVLSHLRKHDAGASIMSEEAAPDSPSTGRRWVVDPLDGTTNFIHGVPTFGVSVALEDERGLLAGAVHDPMRDETFHAHRGGGARLNGKTIRCTEPARMADTLIATGFPFRELSRLELYIEAFEAFVRATAGLRRAGAASIDLAYTACGRYDGFWEIGLSRWDVAAGTLIVAEAGGLVTDVVGGDTHLETGDILAASPGLHAAMLEVTRAVFR